MKIRAYEWIEQKVSALDRTASVNTRRTVEVKVPHGVYAWRAVESHLYSVDGAWLCRDDSFEVLFNDRGTTDYSLYPVNREVHAIPGGPMSGNVVVTEFLVVSATPFRLRTRGMPTDDDYGTDRATYVDTGTWESAPVLEDSELEDFPCEIFGARLSTWKHSQLLNPPAVS